MAHLSFKYREFPGGNQLENLGDFVVSPGSPINVTAQNPLTLPDPMNPPSGELHYAFLFWNVVGSVITTVSATGTAPSGDSFATAWYIRTGPGGGGSPGVATFAFSDGGDVVVSGTPIASVTPAAAWAGGNATGVSTTNTTDPTITITARAAVPGDPVAGETFDSWVQFGSGTPAGSNLSVPHAGSSYALATYAVHKGTHFPSVSVVAELSGILQRILINVGDPAPGDLSRVVEQITEQLATRPIEGDELTQALAQLDQLSAVQIQTALVGAQTRMKRLEGATALLTAALKQAQG